MTITLTSSGAVVVKAGPNAGTMWKDGHGGVSGEDIVNEFINQAESFIIVRSNVNWIDIYSTLNADFKKVLDEATSNLAAIYLVQADYSGFVDTRAAESKMDVLHARAMSIINTLSDLDNVSFMGATKNE